MLLRRILATATIMLATLLMAIAPAQASPVLVGGIVYGAFPVTITAQQPTAVIVNFNGSFTSLSRVCVSLEFDAALGGEGLGVNERMLMVLPGGGSGTQIRNESGATVAYASGCTSDPADLAVLKRGAWQVRFFMEGAGSVRATGAAARAQL